MTVLEIPGIRLKLVNSIQTSGGKMGIVLKLPSLLYVRVQAFRGNGGKRLSGSYSPYIG